MAAAYFTVFVTVVAITSALISLRYNGPGGCPCDVSIFDRVYFSTINMLAPGFTEFVPATEFDRWIAIFQSLLGLALNAFVLTLLVARALRPRDPFVVVPFLLYDPARRRLVIRLYQRLPMDVYNVEIRFHRFGTVEDAHGDQLGRSKQVRTSPEDRHLLRPYYGLLVSIDVNHDLDPRNSSMLTRGVKNSVPREWLTDRTGHFYLTVSADSMFGRLYQTRDFFVDGKDMRVGKHRLLNDGRRLSLDEWYDWKSYDWDAWESIDELEDQFTEDPVAVEIRGLGEPDANRADARSE